MVSKASWAGIEAPAVPRCPQRGSRNRSRAEPRGLRSFLARLGPVHVQGLQEIVRRADPRPRAGRRASDGTGTERSGRNAAFEEARTLQLLEARQVLDGIEAEMLEEGRTWCRR